MNEYRFSDQSESFINGIEYGRILQKMQDGLPIVDNDGIPIHEQNYDIIRRAAEYYGYNASFQKLAIDGWIGFKATKGIN